jgi:hypothetical protein
VSDPKEIAQALQKLRADLAGARGKGKLDLIFAAPNPGALVRRLPAEDLYFTIQEIGIEDSAELVAFASPEQFRAFVDLDCWKGEELDAERVLTWLHAAREHGLVEGSDERFRAKLKQLDIEVVELLLRRGTLLHDLVEEPDPQLKSDMFWRSPEGKYLIEFTGSATDYARLREVLDAYYAQDPFLAARLMEAVRWEIPSELEETALRWRRGRLRDLGFPDLDEALEMYRPPPPGPPAAPPDLPEPEPRFYLAAFEAGLFLDRAAAHLDEDARARFQEGLVYVCNCAVVAEGAEPSDPEAVRRAVETARATLSLGLEQLAAGDPLPGAEIAASWALKRVFQHGFHLTVELGQKARPVALAAAPARGAPLFDAPERHVVAGLLLRRPRFFDAAAGAMRPFSGREDLRRADTVLEACTAATAKMRALGLDLAAAAQLAAACGRDLTSLTYSDLLVTACAHAALDRTFAFAPLAPEDVPRLCAPGILDRLAAAIEERAAGLLRDRALQRVADELRRPCEAGGLDAKFTPVLLVRTPAAKA